MNKEKTIFSLPRFKNVQWDINELHENSTVMSKLLKFAMFAAFALLLFGVKLWLIDFNGNITPFMDQWDAEALGLYHPYLTNTLSWEHMVAPHNEHRIFTTRLIALGLLEINNSWNPLLQMVFNAGAHILTIMMTVYLMSLVVSKKSIPALLAFSLVLFGLPYAWENTLAAFQLQFYLIVFFSVGALWLMLSAEPLGWRWWCGIALGVLAFLSLASGVFVFAVAAFVGTIIFFGNLRRTPRQLTAIAILLVLFIIGTKLTPTLEGHAGLKAASFKQFFNASIVIFGWPVSQNFFAAIFCNLPILIFVFMVLKKLPVANDRRWFLFALAVWGVVQGLSLAYGRAATPNSPRYRDLIAMIVMINFCCLLYLAYNPTVKRRLWLITGAAAWTGAMVLALGIYCSRHVRDEITTLREVTKIGQVNTRDYVLSRKMSYLQDKPPLHIPYPNAERLANIIDTPGIRSILPVSLGGYLAPRAIEIRPVNMFIPNGYYFTTPQRQDSTWGSYIPGDGDGATGEITLRFNNPLGGQKIAIPVAGYPTHEGIHFEVEQNGERTPVSIGEDPKESWGTAYADIKPGDFAIKLKDSSKSTWIAVAMPSVIGRFDNLVQRILSGYYLFALLGIAIVVVLILYKGLSNSNTSTTVG